MPAASISINSEVPSSILSRPEAVTLAQARRLMLDYPLDRFVIQGFLERLRAEQRVRLRPEVWAGLAWRDVLLLRRALAEQVRRYYARIEHGGGEIGRGEYGC